MRRNEGYRRFGGRWRPNDRQRAVLDLLVEGRTNPEIAEALGITLDGAKWHVGELLSRTGCADRECLASWWRERSDRGSRALWPLLLGASLALGGLVLAFMVLTSPWSKDRPGQEEVAAFPDGVLLPEGIIEGEPTAASNCPEQEGDLRAVSAAELAAQGLQEIGSAFAPGESGCPALVANRDDRAFVRISEETIVQLQSDSLPEVMLSIGANDLSVLVGTTVLTATATRNPRYEGSGQELVLEAHDDTGRPYRIAADSGGGLWVSAEPLSEADVFEYWTGVRVDVAEGLSLTSLIREGRPSPEAWAKPVFFFTSCFNGICQVSFRPGDALVAPADGVLRCITGEEAKQDQAGVPSGEIELDTGVYVLRFVELCTSGANQDVDKSCRSRDVVRGEEIGYHYHYSIRAFDSDGSPISVAVAWDGTLYVGAVAPVVSCPCVMGN